MKHSNKSSGVLILFIILVIFFLGLVFGGRIYQNIRINNFLQQIYNNVVIHKGGQIKKGNIWRKDEDGYYYNISGLVIEMTQIERFDGVINSKDTLYFSEYNRTIEPEFLKVAKNNNMTLDVNNSSDFEDRIRGDDFSQDYIYAYSDGGIYCVYHLLAFQSQGKNRIENYEDGINYDITNKIGCFTKVEYDKNIKRMSKFVKDLNLKYKWQILEQYEDFYYIGVSNIGIIAKKNKDNSYTTIRQGNSDIDCKSMKEFNVPKRVYGDCYDL